MAKKKGDYKIPFDEFGNLKDYVEEWHKGVTWKDNFELTDTLQLDSISRGRSAANFIYKSTEFGSEYTMFMTDLVSMIQEGIPCDEVNGVWTFVKRGANYGIRFLRLAEPKTSY